MNILMNILYDDADQNWWIGIGSALFLKLTPDDEKGSGHWCWPHRGN